MGGVVYPGYLWNFWNSRLVTERKGGRGHWSIWRRRKLRLTLAREQEGSQIAELARNPCPLHRQSEGPGF